MDSSRSKSEASLCTCAGDLVVSDHFRGQNEVCQFPLEYNRGAQQAGSQLAPSRVKLGLIQPAKVTVLEQRVVEKRQFTMANLLPTEAPCQFGVKPVGRSASSSLTARLPAGREWKG